MTAPLLLSEKRVRRKNMSNGAKPHKHINTMSVEKILYIDKVDLGDLRKITQTDIISVD